jgi:hypothetical protein
MPKILLIKPYKFYPPTKGGSLRCFYLMREMAKNHEVHVLTIQPNEDFTEGQYPSFPESVRIISIHGEIVYHSISNTLARKALNALNFRFLRRSLSGNINSYYLHTYLPLLKVLKQ